MLKKIKKKLLNKYNTVEECYFTSKKTRLLLWMISIGTIAMSMLILNCLTPYLADDYNYLSKKDIITKETLNGLPDYLQALKNFYFNWGGRITGVAYTYLFMLIPKALFNLLNTMAYMGVISLIYYICKGTNKHKLSLFIGIHFLLWICVPDYGQVMFWVSGSANYLWAALPILGMILIFRKSCCREVTLEGEKTIVKMKHNFTNTVGKQILLTVITFILGVLAGWSSENASAGMLVILTLYLIYNRTNDIKSKGFMISGYIGSIIGFLLLVVAPGNSARAVSEGVELSILFKLFMISYFWISNMIILCGLYFLFRIVSTSLMKIEKKTVSYQSLFFILGALSAAFCMVAAPTSPERTWFIVVVYGIISLGLYYSHWDLYIQEGEKSSDSLFLLRHIIFGVLSITTIFCTVMWADTVISSYEIATQTKDRNTLILSEIENGNKDIVIPIIAHKYPLLSNHDALYGLSDIQDDQQYWINQSIAQYYGINSVLGYDLE